MLGCIREAEQRAGLMHEFFQDLIGRRSGRIDYLMRILTIMVSGTIFTWIIFFLYALLGDWSAIILFPILVIIPTLAMFKSIGRLRDIGWPGILVLLLLIPGLNLIFFAALALWPGEKAANQFGPPPPFPDIYYIVVVVCFYGVLIAIGLGFSIWALLTGMF